MNARLHALAVVVVLLLLAFAPASAMLPDVSGVTRFGIIGDSGTGEKPEYEVAQRLAEYRAKAPFDFVVMLGDNMYGSERPQDFDRKFTEPFKPLLDAGVKFYATLGNHDDPDQRFFKPFNMNGQRYYTFTKGPVEFFVIDSNYMDPKQRDWLEKQLAGSRSKWKIVYGHHPLYSTGNTHGSETDLRAVIEPLFVKYHVNIVLAGHEHFYERLKPQKGIAYFIEGGAAKLRDGDIQHTELEATGFDKDRSFMVAQVAGDTFQFEAISRTGEVIDSGTVINTSRETSQQ